VVAQHYGRNGLPIICELWDEKNPASKKPKNEGATLHTYGQLYSPDASGTQAGKPNFERACLLEYQIRRV